MIGRFARTWNKPLPRRAMLLLIALLALAILGFYTVTDSSRVADNHLLGASDYVGYAVCHRITERSFTVAGRQLPLCARCTGMYLGVTLTFIVLTLAGRRRWSKLPPPKVLAVLIGFIVLFAIDGINSYSHFFTNAPHVYEPQNWLRLLTGMGAGLTMGIIIYPALAQTLWREQIFRPSIGSLRELAALVLVALLVFALVLSEQPVLLYILGLASAAGVLLILAAIGTMLILIIAKRDARAQQWRQVALPLFGGLIFAVLQIAIVSFARFSVTGTMSGLPGL
jgi:uncharacterized membrane protein